VWCFAYRNLAKPLLLTTLCALSATLPAWASTVQVEDDKGHMVLFYNYSRALLIGQSKFGKGWNELKHVPIDLADLKKAFLEQGFDEVEVVENLDGRDILPKIDEFVSKDTGKATRTIVYVTGHGWVAPNGTAYLVGHDADLPGPGSQPQISRMLPVTALKELHTTSAARHTLLVLDSCYSGAVLDTKSAGAPARLVAEQMQKPVFQLLASGQKDQRVSGDGVFARLFVSGMEGAAAQDRDRKFVTFRQLANWLFFELPRRSNQVPVYADYPAPDGDMVFLTQAENILGPEQPKRQEVTLASQFDATQRTAASQAGSFRASFPTTSVYYYRKASDGLNVVDAMNKLGVDYVARPAELPEVMKTNALACGPTTSIDALKSLARALVSDGVPIARIALYKDAGAKQGRIEVLSSADGVDPKTKQYTQNLHPLSLSEIDAIQSCRTVESKKGSR